MFIFEHSIHVAMWDYLVKNPSIDKCDWPGWSKYTHLDQNILKDAHYCLACYYMLQYEAASPSHRQYVGCSKCPLIWPGIHCAIGEFEGLFNKFRHAANDQEKAAVAILIRDLPIQVGVNFR